MLVAPRFFQTSDVRFSEPLAGLVDDVGLAEGDPRRARPLLAAEPVVEANGRRFADRDELWPIAPHSLDLVRLVERERDAGAFGDAGQRGRAVYWRATLEVA